MCDVIFVQSFTDDGVETADTAYTLALAYANVKDDDAESMSLHCPMSPTLLINYLCVIIL